MLVQKQESYRKGIINSTLLNIVSKGLGFINSILLVYLFGTNLGTDAYFLVISTATFVASFFIGAVSYVIIPEAMRLRINEGVRFEQEYLNFFFWLFLFAGVLLFLLVLLQPVFFYSLFSKFTSEELSASRKLLLLSCFVFPLNLLTNFLILVLTSHKYFTVPMVVAIINSCIGIILVFALKGTLGITAAIVAYIAGSAINIVWILYYMVRKLKWSFFQFSTPSKKNWRNLLLAEINLLPVSFRSYTMIYMLSGLGAGIITAYNYGMQIALIPEIMIVSQVNAVFGIKFNELSATDNMEEMNRLFQQSMKLLFGALLPVALIFSLLSSEIIEVIFLFKNKTGDNSFMLIAGFIACFAITLPFRAIDAMVASVMIARQKIKEGVVFSFLLNCTIIAITIIVVQEFGLRGFYWLIVFVFAILIPVFYIFFTKKILPFLKLGQWFRQSFFYMVLMLGAATGVFFLKKYYLEGTGLMNNITVVGIVIIAAAFFFNKLTGYTRFTLKS